MVHNSAGAIAYAADRFWFGCGKFWFSDFHGSEMEAEIGKEGAEFGKADAEGSVGGGGVEGRRRHSGRHKRPARRRRLVLGCSPRVGSSQSACGAARGARRRRGAAVRRGRRRGALGLLDSQPRLLPASWSTACVALHVVSGPTRTPCRLLLLYYCLGNGLRRR